MDADNNRQWIPAEWLDEMVPPMLESPDDYCSQKSDGTWQVRLPEGEEYFDGQCSPIDIEPGQPVGFSWRDTYGDFTVTVADDRTYSVNAGYPAEATHFWCPEFMDQPFDTLDELVNCTEFGEALPPGEHKVAIYRWGEADVRLIFAVVDGKGTFIVPTAGAN